MTKTNIKVYLSGPADFGRDNAWFGQLCLKALEAAEFGQNYPGFYEINIGLTHDDEIRELNKKHRGKDKATNVLSFPLYDPDEILPPGAPAMLGDIVLAFETIMRESEEQDKDFHDHVAHLVIHGVLHLIGYDHENDEDAEIMEALEIAVLEGMGIKNPYNT